MNQEEIRGHTDEMEWIRHCDAESVVETLMEKYGSDLKKLAFSYVKDWGKAEDITQEVFFTCFKKIERFKGSSAVKTWLYRVTINRCKDMLKSWSFRKIRPGDPTSMHSLEGDSPSPESETVRQDENQQLTGKVMALPLKYQEVIILYYYSGLKTGELARLLKQNAKTIRTRLRRARELLKSMYEEVNTDGR